MKEWLYDDFVYCDKEMIDDFIPKAQRFVNEIKALLNDMLWVNRGSKEGNKV